MKPMEWVTQVHFSVNAGDCEEVENKGGKEDPGAIYVAHPGLFIKMSAYWIQNYTYKMQKLKKIKQTRSLSLLDYPQKHFKYCIYFLLFLCFKIYFFDLREEERRRDR